MRLIRSMLFLALASSAGVAAAEWPHQWLARDFKTTFCRNSCWPEPFVRVDRAHVAAPMIAMINKGWEEQNILGPHHFNSETNELTDAGLIKLQWILTQAPMQHRTAFVERDVNPQITELRVANTENASRKLLAGQPGDIQQTELVSGASSGAYFDTVYQKFQASTPDPRIPAPNAGSLDTGL